MQQRDAQLPKAYTFSEVEDKLYAFWETKGFFHAQANPSKRPYTIVIPPPNITGILTMGHVLNNTIQDGFVRWRRMQGFEACWIPGTDHAGIATQNAVEKALAKEGLNRHQLGREEFLKRVWQWKELYGNTIIRQLRKLGVSCDWERERFTMDEGLSEAVKEVFVRLFDKGLVYRGKYIVNWCPFHRTALSDDEVDYAETDGKLYHIAYTIEGLAKPALIATTRPETLLGDTAIAVNPGDERYADLIGRSAVVPLVNRRVPIIADDYVDTSFGTGMLKVTPAHDPNDFLVGQRHGLEQINIFEEDGRLNSSVPKQYEGLDRFECRRRVVQDLEALGSLHKVEEYRHNVGRCYRCETVIEPYLSDQWFVKMKPLAVPALRVVHKNLVRFHPERWTKVYEHWMMNIRDWCISRQIWWGHRIPVYTGPDGRFTAARNEDEARHRLGLTPSEPVTQDENVLDTWFSSWLWPFSTLGWPKDSEDLRYFNPTDTLVTGPDIIFFWVARMVMANMEFMKGTPRVDGRPRSVDEELVPFRNVYFTSIVRDAKGRKLSKSLGNSPDPLDVIKEYGADGLRFTITYLAPIGQDVIFSLEKCEIGRNFANKVWNAGRFLLMNKAEILGQKSPDLSRLTEEHTDLADRWILSRLNHAIGRMNAALEDFQINEATKILYSFIWHDFCDWYVELVKTRLYGTEQAEVKQAVLVRALWVFDQALRLLHPIMPFVTEELWQHLVDRKGEPLMRSAFPREDPRWIDDSTEEEMDFVQEVITSVRTIRGENNLPPAAEIVIKVRTADGSQASALERYGEYLRRLAKVVSCETLSGSEHPRLSASAVVRGAEVFVPLVDLIDIDAERGRLDKEISRVRQHLDSITRKLSNAQFVERAPEEVVAKEREKQEQITQNLAKLERHLRELSS